MEARLPELGLTRGDLFRPTLALAAPATTGAMPLSLVVQIGRACAGSGQSALVEALPSNLQCGALRLGMRTLNVIANPARTSNPTITGITVVAASGSRAVARLARSADTDLVTSRAAAAASPIVLDEGTDVTLEVEAADPGAPAERTLRYQWISTGGDFHGHRKKNQPWTAPLHRAPGPDERDQTGRKAPDPRADPNLHPVWLILRDDTSRGQVWAELHVRVTGGG